MTRPCPDCIAGMVAGAECASCDGTGVLLPPPRQRHVRDGAPWWVLRDVWRQSGRRRPIPRQRPPFLLLVVLAAVAVTAVVLVLPRS